MGGNGISQQLELRYGIHLDPGGKDLGSERLGWGVWVVVVV